MARAVRRHLKQRMFLAFEVRGEKFAVLPAPVVDWRGERFIENVREQFPELDARGRRTFTRKKQIWNLGP